MTESLADGPDWHLRSRFRSGLPLFSAVNIESGSSIVVLHGFNSRKWSTDENANGSAKTFPDTCVSQMQPKPNFFANMETTLEFATHSSSLPLPSQEMSLNIDTNRILPVKVSGASPSLLSRSVTLPQNCNVVNAGEMFHSNSVGSPLIPSLSLQLLSIVILSILFFQASLDSGC